MNQKGNHAKGHGSLGPTISEEIYRSEFREMIRGLLRAWGGDLRKIHPNHPQEEHLLGFDDLFAWGGLSLNLASPSPPQSGISLRSPLLVQYKVSQTDHGDFVYSLATAQYLIMLAFEKLEKCALYALCRARTLRELEMARKDLFGMSFLVQPSELNIHCFAHEEHLLTVNPQSGLWSTRPVESKVLPIPFDSDFEKIRIRLESALAELDPPEPIREGSSSLELIHTAYEVAQLITGNTNSPGHIKQWRDYEIKEG